MKTGVRGRLIQRSRRDLIRETKAAGLRRAVEVAGIGANIARQLCPVDSGALRDSIREEVHPRRSAALVIAGSEAVDYAAAVELGTATSAPQPFMRPAAELAAKRNSNVGVRLRVG